MVDFGLDFNPFHQVAFMGIREDFVQVRQAAEILGVAQNTIRAWGANGKLPEYRHPVNGYRLYKRRDLENLLKKLEQSVHQTATAGASTAARKRGR